MAGVIRMVKHEAIAIITIDRPDVRNALSFRVLMDLSEICNELSCDQKLRAAIFTGEGETSFCAGADLKERQEMSEAETLTFVEKIQKTFQQIADLPIPTIASINGDALGGGLELALSCDIRVININAYIGLTECSLGVIPGAGGTQRLPRIIGISRAMDMIFLAKRISGQEAVSIGIANYSATGAGKTQDLAIQLATKISYNAPLAIRAAKEAILASNQEMIDGLMAELASYHEILDTDDRREGLLAFKEKRAPRFEGK